MAESISLDQDVSKLPWFPEYGDPIEVLNLSVRSTNALIRAGITTVDRLLNTDKKILCDIRNLGEKSIAEILGCQEKLVKALAAIDAHSPDNLAKNRERLEKLKSAFADIPAQRMNHSLHRYLASCAGEDIIGILEEFNELLAPLTTIAELPSVFESICTSNRSTDRFLSILSILSINMSSMIQDIFNTVYSDSRNKRAYLVLCQRSGGMTLQEIAEKMGITRSRVQQIETKGLDKLLKYLGNITVDFFLFISAEHNGDYIITVSELCGYLGKFEYMNLFLYVAKMTSMGNTFIYNRDLGAFCYKGAVHNFEHLKEVVKNLPFIINKEKKDMFLADISKAHELPLKAVAIEFYYTYRLTGSVYYRGKLILTQVYDYILDTYYPSGIKLYDDGTINSFRKKVTEIFGDIDLPVNNRAIDARLGDIAILCEQGTYIHPHHIQIERALIDEVCVYIMNSGRVAFSFNELFETFKDKLLVESNVHNKYFFQGVLKYYLSDKFFFTRGVIAKEEGADIIEDLETLIRERGEIHKSEIFVEYPGITDIMFIMRINANKNIISIGNGSYMHVNKLKIMPRDYHIREVLEQQTKKLPVSSRKVLELLKVSSPRFLTRNDITHHEKLFGILKYMFDTEFIFSRPYIAKLGTEEISNINIIKQYLKSYDSITLADLTHLCNEQRVRFFSPKILIKDLNDEFLRIDSETLVRSVFKPDEEIITEIGRILLERMKVKGYLVASTIGDYIVFPHIPFQWNAFVLRSLVEKYMHDLIHIVDIPTTDIYAISTIFVDPILKVENYEALIQYILKTEHTKAPFKIIRNAVDWLRQEGLFIGNPPKCLLDGSIICLDKFGKIIVK
ncbi:MAG: hypothetical protein LBU17_11195 [Treponema sp.]|nr:hypothetical protein [Treponema sp.]